MTENSMVTKDHFSDLRTQLIKIKEDNEKVVFDYENDEKEARSYVATLRKSKTAISNRHKEKKKSILEDGRKLDSAKNELISEVEEMIEVHAKPLQEIKDRKDAEIELERKRVEQEIEDERLRREKELADREAEIAAKEAAIAQAEADKLAKEKAEQDEKDRIEYEAKVKTDAEAKAKKDAEEALLKEQQEKERLIQEAKQREEQVKIDAENAEKQRLADIEEAKQKAEREKQEALDKQRWEQEQKEAREKFEAEKQAAYEKKKAANLNHVKAVNNRVLKKLVALGLAEDKAKDIMEDIIKNPIPEITINY